jgi:hypothetical protein
VIVSDWDLSNRADENGDAVLKSVREKDWDVPFVLVSGKLGEASDRASVLETLLDNGGAGFVERGEGISRTCDLAEDLIERRDLALLKTLLTLRAGALANKTVPTSSGAVSVRKELAALVSKPSTSHNVSRPLAQALRPTA